MGRFGIRLEKEKEKEKEKDEIKKKNGHRLMADCSSSKRCVPIRVRLAVNYKIKG